MPERIAKAIMGLGERMRTLKAIQEDQAGDGLLSDREFMILDLLDAKGKMMVSEIAAAEPNVSYSTISTSITKLWQRKMLTKTVEPENQRVTIVELAEKGKEALETLRKQRSERFERLFEAINLTDGEREVFLQVLDRANDYFDKLFTKSAAEND